MAASYVKKIRVSTTGTSDWLEVPCTSPSLDFTSEVIDTTNLANASPGFRSRLTALHDWSINCDSNYTNGNAALVRIRNAALNRTILYAQYLPEGTVSGGYQGEVVVENFNLSGEVNGIETVGITLQGNGTLSDAT